FDGEVPHTIDELVRLPGVARKTANVVAAELGTPQGVVVDTHVRRLSQRLGFTKQEDPMKIERDLIRLVPREDWGRFPHLLIWHGRRVCIARGRPDYPAAAIAKIVERLGLRPGRTVLDLAAGTGKLTRLLVPSGANVLAVEPVREMRAELERRVPGVATLGGTAERIPMNDGFLDAVTVGQAFHWFDAPRALREIHRVLRPGGGLALIWNARDERDPLQAALSEIIDPLEGDTPRRKQGNWKTLLAESGLYERTERVL